MEVRDREIEALQTTLKDLSGVLGFLSARSFAATIQVVILNLASIGGLVSGSIVLEGPWRAGGFVFLLLFNLIAFVYLAEKSRSFRRCWNKARWVERRLSRHLPRSLRRLPRPKITRTRWRPASEVLFLSNCVLSGVAALFLVAFWPTRGVPPDAAAAERPVAESVEVESSPPDARPFR